MLYAILQACKAHILSCKPLPRGIVILETNKCNFVWTEHMTSNNRQPTASTRWGMWRLVQMVRCGVVTQNLYKMSRFIRINILTTARGLHHRCCTAGPFVTLSHAAALIGAFMAPSWIWCRWARGQSEYWNIPLCLDIKIKNHIIVMLLERRVYWICLDMFLFSMICSYENVIQLECAAVRTSCSWTQAACIGHAPCSVVPNTPTLQHCTARWESGKTGRSL